MIFVLLVQLGILDIAMLRHYRPHAVVAVMIFAAVLTPTTDMVTMLLMGVPMYLLYEICIVIAVLRQRRAAKPALDPVE